MRALRARQSKSVTVPVAPATNELPTDPKAWVVCSNNIPFSHPILRLVDEPEPVSGYGYIRRKRRATADEIEMEIYRRKNMGGITYPKCDIVQPSVTAAKVVTFPKRHASPAKLTDDQKMLLSDLLHDLFSLRDTADSLKMTSDQNGLSGADRDIATIYGLVGKVEGTLLNGRTIREWRDDVRGNRRAFMELLATHIKDWGDD